MHTESVQPDSPFSEDVLLLSLARGASHRQAAVDAGCSPSTVTRRLQDGAFKLRVTACRSEILGRSSGLLADATLTAAKKLKALCRSENDVVALAASKAVLEMAGRYRDQTEIVERLAALEGRHE